MRGGRRAAFALLAGFGISSTAIYADEPATAAPHCAIFSKVRDNLSPSFGSRVDPLTRFAGMEVICDRKAMVFRQDVNLARSDIDSNWIAVRSRHWSRTYCDRHPVFAQAIMDGWTISTIMTLKDGQTMRIDAVCHDAEA